ncbi:MAG: glycosyltransferase, partial [Gaiellaceae bacterium]
MIAKVLFWSSLGALAWTQGGYPLAAAALARVRGRAVRKGDFTPPVTVVVAAHNEETVIERRLQNLFAQDYPRDRFDIVVASDASTDRTDELVEETPGVRLIRCPRGGKVAAQNTAVRQTEGEILAFSDANAVWEPDALRALVARFADPRVGYACGQVRFVSDGGTNQEGVYWRYEMAVRALESRLCSITAGNGAIYAVRREAYVRVDPVMGHDLTLPFTLVKGGWRAV